MFTLNLTKIIGTELIVDLENSGINGLILKNEIENFSINYNEIKEINKFELEHQGVIYNYVQIKFNDNSMIWVMEDAKEVSKQIEEEAENLFHQMLVFANAVENLETESDESEDEFLIDNDEQLAA